MFTTIEQVKDFTGYDVTTDLIYQAQAIIEAYSGRIETEVKLAKDREVLAKSTAYQAAYMVTNYETIFEQVGLTSMQTPDGALVLDITMSAPYIAPLAVITLRGLSARGGKSVKIGSTFGRSARSRANAYADWVTDSEV